jgi:hypothetical protein
MGALYSIVFPNGKQYIGITSRDTAAERFKEHLINADRPAPPRSAVYAALKKYGPAAAVLRTLADGIDDWELLCLAEQEAIDKFKCRVPSGYNLTAGGEGVRGAVWSASSRALLSQVRSDIMQTDEHRQRVSQQTKKLWETTDIGGRLAEGRKAHWASAENVAAATEKTRKQMENPDMRSRLREAAKARWQDPAYRARMAEKARLQMLQRMKDPAYLEKIASGRKKASNVS